MAHPRRCPGRGRAAASGGGLPRRASLARRRRGPRRLRGRSEQRSVVKGLDVAAGGGGGCTEEASDNPRAVGASCRSDSAAGERNPSRGSSRSGGRRGRRAIAR
eukprot:1476191-Prymnesium_polylepis.1